MGKLLPIGSIVKLKTEGEFLFMIIGYYAFDQEKNAKFDYLSVLYPYGIDNEYAFYPFNENEIKEIVFEGYMDDESEEFLKIYPVVHEIGNIS